MKLTRRGERLRDGLLIAGIVGLLIFTGWLEAQPGWIL